MIMTINKKNKKIVEKECKMVWFLKGNGYLYNMNNIYEAKAGLHFMF